MSLGSSSDNQFREDIDTFKVKFEGGNSIDAELFAKTINNTIALVKACSHAINPDASLHLEIQATKEGSFEVIIDLVVEQVKHLFTLDNISLAKDIIIFFKGCLELKSHLKGQKPESIDYKKEEATIKNHSGERLTTQTTIVNNYSIIVKLILGLYKCLMI